MKHSESITNLAAALEAAQAELRAVGLDSVNPHFKNKYASLDNIIETVRPTLAKHGLAVVQGATTPESDANAKVTGFSVETMLIHSSGQWLANAVVMPLGKADPQGAGGALTYGRRYGLSALLSLATDEDDDGQSAARQRNEGNRGNRTGGPANAGGAAGSTKEHLETTQQPTAQPADFIMPIGKQRGNRIGDIASPALQEAAQWVLDKSLQKKYAEFLIAIAAVLKQREERAVA